MTRKKAIEFVAARIIAAKGRLNEKGLDKLKRIAGRKFGISDMIKNPELLAALGGKNKASPAILNFLLKKPTKTLSGVTPVAVMIQPEGSCKWGCIYCPVAGLAAKSYTGFEPAALRARQFNFDPYLQASNRVKQLDEGGHATDKCEIIVMGGTFLEMSSEYKRSFIKGIYDGLNCRKARTMEASIKNNERSHKHRAIGLTIETRPNVCTSHIDEMLSYGATRVELGVQHADDRIYKLINRGHTVHDVVDATKALKNAAFKVLYHVMPGLPGSTKAKDISFVKRLFNDEAYQPDMLKIYPTLVIGGTILHRMMLDGDYTPYTSEEAADVISEFYRYIPKYVRVMRIQRDIPATKIERGVNKSNLRELVEAKIREKGIEPQEIRYREVGLNRREWQATENKRNVRATNPLANNRHREGKFEMNDLQYKASGGKEHFISYENREGLIAGFIRLRLPPKTNSALIRELHIYGSEIPIDSTLKEGIQHKGLGQNLLSEAETTAKAAGYDNMSIISGVGVREYYRKRGYRLSGNYMVKRL